MWQISATVLNLTSCQKQKNYTLDVSLNINAHIYFFHFSSKWAAAYKELDSVNPKNNNATIRLIFFLRLYWIIKPVRRNWPSSKINLNNKLKNVFQYWFIFNAQYQISKTIWLRCKIIKNKKKFITWRSAASCYVCVIAIFLHARRRGNRSDRCLVCIAYLSLCKIKI